MGELEKYAKHVYTDGVLYVIAWSKLVASEYFPAGAVVKQMGDDEVINLNVPAGKLAAIGEVGVIAGKRG